MVIVRRKAFTLVELLIVISIIGVLMGLIIPAVQSVKEATKRTQCVNNQKQLSLAVLQYQNSFRRFPGYVNTIGPDSLPASWAVMLFPYIDRADLANEWSGLRAPNGDLGTPPRPPAAPDPNYHNPSHLELLVCPTNPPASKDDSMWSYAVNGGYAGDVQDPNVNEHIFNGAFFNHCPSPGLPVASMVISGTDYISEHDGVATTIMLTENVQQYKPPFQTNPAHGRWTPGPVGWRTVYFDSTSTSTTYNDVVRGRNGRAVIWFNADRSTDPMTNVTTYNVGRKINVEIDWPFNDSDHARPSSFHPQGVVMTFCDGHSKFIKQSIEYDVYKQLMTSYGTHANLDPAIVPPDIRYPQRYDSINRPLSESDY